MSLPRFNDLEGLDFAFDGEPFCSGPAKPDIILGTMDYALDATPFVANQSVWALTLRYAVTTNLGVKKSRMTFAYDVSTSLNTVKKTDRFRTFNYAVVTALDLTSALYHEYDNSFTCKLGVLQFSTNNFTSKLGVLVSSRPSFTTQLGVMEYSLAAVTNVCSLSNPYQPAIIVDGAYITPFTSPVISDPTQHCLFIGMLNAGVTGIDICKLHNFGFTLDKNGGSWFLSTPESIYNCFDIVTIFGFKGIVTAKGIELNGNSAGFTYSGIFGTNALNMNMEYLFIGNSIFNALLSNQSLNPNISSLWATCRSACQQIIDQANVVNGNTSLTLQWLIPDQPLTNLRPQEGTTGLATLQSLAQQAGGELRWDGNDGYKVVYPDFYEGLWIIPSCDLFLSPVKCETYCDLARGRSYSQSPIANLPGFLRSQLSRFDAGTKSLNPKNKGGAAPQVQLITKITKLLTVDDAPLIYDLPYNYDQVFIQTLIPSGQSTGGNNYLGINWNTINPQQFFNFEEVGLANSYIFTSNIGGVQQPQVKVDYKVLSVKGSNDSVDNSHFTTSLYYTTKAVDGPEAANDRSNLSGQLRYSFYKTNSCTFSVQFYGSLPVLGMKAVGVIQNVKLLIPDCNNPGGHITQIIGDIDISGIVETVNFAFPDTVTVTVANYLRLLIYNTSESNGTIPVEEP